MKKEEMAIITAAVDAYLERMGLEDYRLSEPETPVYNIAPITFESESRRHSAWKWSLFPTTGKDKGHRESLHWR
ncbi:MAG: hypothetical protein WC980_06690 [Candidatus Brocadiia bacterium]